MIFLLFAILVTLNVIDGLETYSALSGSGFDEINPGGRFLFTHLGLVPGIIVFKTTILFGVGLVSLLAPTAYGLALNIPLIGWGLFTFIRNHLVATS